MGDITFLPSFPLLYRRLWASTELSLQPHFTAGILEDFPPSLCPLQGWLGTNLVPYSGGAVTHCQAVLVCGAAGSLCEERAGLRNAAGSSQSQLASTDPAGHSRSSQCCWWYLWEKILKKGQKSHSGRGMKGGESEKQQGEGQGQRRRRVRRCSRHQSRCHLQPMERTMVEQVPPAAHGEDHSGAGMACRLWKTMMEQGKV